MNKTSQDWVEWLLSGTPATHFAVQRCFCLPQRALSPVRDPMLKIYLTFIGDDDEIFYEEIANA